MQDPRNFDLLESKRYKAALADGIVLMICFIISFTVWEEYRDTFVLRVHGSTCFGLFMLYEVIMVASGGTLGHRLFGIKVRGHAHPEQKIPIHKAALRFLFKWCGPAFIHWKLLRDEEGTVLIHDRIAGSVILNK